MECIDNNMCNRQWEIWADGPGVWDVFFFFFFFWGGGGGGEIVVGEKGEENGRRKRGWGEHKKIKTKQKYYIVASPRPNCPCDEGLNPGGAAAAAAAAQFCTRRSIRAYNKHQTKLDGRVHNSMLTACWLSTSQARQAGWQTYRETGCWGRRAGGRTDWQADMSWTQPHVTTSRWQF